MSILEDIWMNGWDCSLLRSQKSDLCRWDGVSWHGVPAKRCWADLKGSWVLISPVTQYSNKQTSPLSLKSCGEQISVADVATELRRVVSADWWKARTVMARQDWAGQGRKIQLSHVLSSMTDYAFCICAYVLSDKFNAKNIYMLLTLKHQKKYSFILVHLLGNYDHISNIIPLNM